MYVLSHFATPMFQLLMPTRTLVGTSTQRMSLFVMPFHLPVFSTYPTPARAPAASASDHAMYYTMEWID
jgi:hypothetical protein